MHADIELRHIRWHNGRVMLIDFDQAIVAEECDLVEETEAVLELLDGEPSDMDTEDGSSE